MEIITPDKKSFIVSFCKDDEEELQILLKINEFDFLDSNNLTLTDPEHIKKFNKIFGREAYKVDEEQIKLKKQQEVEIKKEVVDDDSTSMNVAVKKMKVATDTENKKARY